MVSILHHLQNLVCKPSLVKLPNLEGNSIKNLKVELTIQIYIIEPSWSSGMNFGHFVFHYSKLCSKLKQNRYLYHKNQKGKKLNDTSSHAASCETLKMRLTGWAFKANKERLLMFLFLFFVNSCFYVQKWVFLFLISLFFYSFWLIQSTGIVMQNSCIFLNSLWCVKHWT